MNKKINDYGKEVWEGIEEFTPFNPDMFHEVDMGDLTDNSQLACHTNLGTLTVLDRMTGFGWRDTETGYRDPDGKFWLASGGYDVTESGVKTFSEAIQWVKDRANSCVGD